MGIGQESRRKKIMIGTLAALIVTVVLGLGLGLGLQLQKCRSEVAPTCRERCYEPFDEGKPGCRCDRQCVDNNTCCYDFQDVCLHPTQQWECTRLRCGEDRLPQSRCHCSADCLQAGDCCTNYKHVCQGEPEWAEDACVDMITPKCPAGFKQQPLLLVSLDGLRAEYLQTWFSLLPVLGKLKSCGTSAPYMQPVFPSKTFPNHYTIVTGLYSESHGLVDNSMYDPVFDATFSLSSSEKDKPRWYQGQPIWHTARYQGLKAGTYFWPGSDVRVNGSFPDIYAPYDGKIPFEERVFTLLKWLQLPDDMRPDFFTLYLEEPDKSGHNFGPVSGGLIKAIQGIDKVMGQLMNGLKQINLHQCVNIIIVADHGMEDTSCDRKEVLQDLVGNTWHLEVTQGSFGRIRSRDKNQPLDPAELVANMTCKKPDQKIKPYLKAHLPKRFHYANSRRIEDVNVLVTPKWLFEKFRGSMPYCSAGSHGYDNDADSMHAMFLSYGPKFLSRTEVDPFSNIELYNLMCDVLEISPHQNNGTHGSLNHLLRTPQHAPTRPAEETAPGHCPLQTLDPPDTLACKCPSLIGNSINSRLNLTDSEVSEVERKHVLFGRPRVLRRGEAYCVLHHQGFVSGYSQRTLMPLWSSFTLDKPEDTDRLPEVTPGCLRADVRVPAESSPTCEQYAPDAARNVSHAFLYPPNLNRTAVEEYDGLLMTNIVPMYPDFKNVWDYFHSTLLKKYASQHNGVNVVSGPAFDYNYDGQFDSPDQTPQFVAGTRIPIPTHYFAVLTSCRNSSRPISSCDQELQTISFLVPHRPDNSESCNNANAASLWVEDLLWFHQSRVRDVEWITGLDLYQDSTRPIPELLRVKTRPTAAIHRKP